MREQLEQQTFWGEMVKFQYLTKYLFYIYARGTGQKCSRPSLRTMGGRAKPTDGISGWSGDGEGVVAARRDYQQERDKETLNERGVA